MAVAVAVAVAGEGRPLVLVIVAGRSGVDRSDGERIRRALAVRSLPAVVGTNVPL